VSEAVEGRDDSLFFPSATASFTAALLGVDTMVDIIRAGGRVATGACVVADDDGIVDFTMGGG
jgi:hypothetical protein